MEREGVIYRINGPVVEANQVTGILMGDIVEVGEEHLIADFATSMHFSNVIPVDVV